MIDLRRMRTASGPLLGAITLVATVLTLHLLGRGALAAPPFRSVDDLHVWLGDRGPVTAAIVAIRLIALGVGYHLIVTTALSTIGRLVRSPVLVRLADASTLPPFRGIVRRITGLGLSASILMATPLEAVNPAARPTVAPVGPAQNHEQPDPAIDGGTSALTLRWADPMAPDSSGTATMRLDEAAPAAGTATLRPSPSADASESDATLAPAAGTAVERAGTPESSHQVVHGDHLWSIAEEHLVETFHVRPSESDVDAYWRRVVAANPQLPNPDLIFPGDRILLPPARP